MDSDSDAVESIADGVDRKLDPRVIPLQRTLGWIPTAILSAISLVLVTFVWADSGILALGLLLMPLWLAGVVALAWQFQRWPAIAYRFASYRIDEGWRRCSDGIAFVFRQQVGADAPRHLVIEAFQVDA